MTPRSRRRTSDAIDSLGTLFPRVVHAVNVVLESCTAGVSKKAGALLWVLYQSDHRDENGETFLENRKIVRTFQRSFALGVYKARKTVSEAKKELYRKKLIDTHGGSMRVYLTSGGRTFVTRMIAKAKGAIRRAVSPLSEAERVVLAAQATAIVNGVLAGC